MAYMREKFNSLLQKIPEMGSRADVAGKWCFQDTRLLSFSNSILVVDFCPQGSKWLLELQAIFLQKHIQHFRSCLFASI